MKNLTQEVKDMVLKTVDFVGITPVERLQNEPEYHRPTDFLPGARTVISLGIKLSQGIQLANKLMHRRLRPRHVIYPYLWHGFGLPSLHYIDRTTLLVTRLLEKEGYISVPIMAASTFGIRNSLTEFSNIHAAVAAGIGELGYCDLVMTPEVGPRARFGSIITTAELDPDPLYEGQQLCQPDKCRQLGKGKPVCVGICPTEAIRNKETLITIGEKEYTIAEVDNWRCTWGSLGLSKKSGGQRDIPMPENVGPEDVYSALSKRSPSQSMEAMVIGRADYCGKCVIECPVGSPQQVNDLFQSVKNRLEKTG